MPDLIHVRTHLQVGTLVYGMPTCSWTQKQRQYFEQNQIPYQFIDCTTQPCPDFVTGYPTIVWTGYAEIPIKH